MWNKRVFTFFFSRVLQTSVKEQLDLNNKVFALFVYNHWNKWEQSRYILLPMPTLLTISCKTKKRKGKDAVQMMFVQIFQTHLQTKQSALTRIKRQCLSFNLAPKELWTSGAGLGFLKHCRWSLFENSHWLIAVNYSQKELHRRCCRNPR